jgi:ubiquinone/menaquinone biosynthesis C-methylase UbiE
MKNASVVLMDSSRRYPKPIRLTGTDYNHFMLHTDKEHIREIANTVRFTEK